MIFLVFSVFYLHIIISLSNGVSALELKGLLQFLKERYYIFIWMAVSLWSVYRIKKISRFFIATYSIAILATGMSLFATNYDKIILMFNFIFILTSFVLFVFWGIELKDIIYCPGYDLHQIGRKSLYPIDVDFELRSGEKIRGYLTNWGQASCFSVAKWPKGYKDDVKINITFENYHFSQKGLVVSHYASGVGIKFFDEPGEKTTTNYNWNEFYNIIKDRGFHPFV
jgi:hypothetical protein